MAALDAIRSAAAERAGASLEQGPDEWIPARLFQQLTDRFHATNVRAVLPDGGSDFEHHGPERPERFFEDGRARVRVAHVDVRVVEERAKEPEGGVGDVVPGATREAEARAAKAKAPERTMGRAWAAERAMSATSA